jgi:hypothetical protein
MPSLNTKKRTRTKKKKECQMCLEKESYVRVPSGLIEDDCQ